MKKSVLSLCAFLMVLSASLCAETKTVSKESKKIECEIIPSGPLSKSRLAYSSFAGQIGQRMGPQTSKSLNWSGYASYTSAAEPEIGSVTNVWGNWSVPKLHPSQESRYSVCWVGIDGFFNQTVEQIGTLQQWINGQQQNLAWFSVYPGPTYEIVGFPVKPNDKIRALVSYIGNDIFEMTIENLTQGVFAVIPNGYTIATDTQRNSAEWIVEAPSMQTILPLAHFTPVNFTQCLASIRGSAQAINGSHGEFSRIYMVTEGGKKAKVKASPSHLFKDGKKFIVKWHHR